MAQQFLKPSVAVAAILSLGLAVQANAQPVQSKDSSGGPVQAKDPSGGPVPAKDRSGGPVPATSNEGMPMQPGAKLSNMGAGAKAGSLDAADRKFVETAAQGGLAEVALGNLGQSKASNPQVKEFAARMVTDHSKANAELKTLAANKGVTLPAAVDAKDQKEADKLGKLTADKFDHEYMEFMVSDHKKDVKEFEKQAKTAKDADVRAFAAKTLPTLQEHLKMAQAAQAAAKSGPKPPAK